ncbi:E3 ubiquitin-protein ligase E3D-like [Styela clava]
MQGARQKQKAHLTIREGFYFMEVCDQVHAINIVLREKDIPLHVLVEPRRISTQSYSGEITIYPLTLEVDPSSCSAMRFNSQEGISMRLQVTSFEDVPTSYIPMGTLVERLSDAFDRLNGQNCFCGCKICGINFLKNNVKFNRVLSLPSEHWEDMSSSWTCCSHSHGKKGMCADTERLKLDEYPFIPRIGEIFENDFYVIFYPKAVVRNNVLLYPPAKHNKNDAKKFKYEKSMLKCGRCYSVIGEALVVNSKSVRTYNFYKSAVEFKSYYEDFLQPIFSSAFLLERVLANELSNEVKSNTTYKFILQDEMKKPYLIIQVLNTDARVRFHLPEYDEPCDHKGNPCCCVEYPPRYLGAEDWELAMPRQMKSDKEAAIKDSTRLLQRAFVSLRAFRYPSVLEGLLKMNDKLVPPDILSLYKFSANKLPLRPTCDSTLEDYGVERVVKVLYMSATTKSGAKLAKDWQKDFNVRVMTFPYSICMDALLVLITSTLSMPVRRTAPEGFLFGIMRVE